ncbi:MmpS family transport accessory protein [Pseudonocardia saturnea]
MRPVRLAAAAVLAAAVVASTASCANQEPPAAGSSTVPPTTSTAASTGSATTSATETGMSVVYEATGSGTAITVDYTPDANGAVDRIESVPLPFTKQVSVGGSPSVYEIVIVGGDDVGCTITLGEQVVAQEPAGASAHCVYQP